MANLHETTVHGFGVEWGHFDQSELPRAELSRLFDSSFEYSLGVVAAHAVGIDLGSAARALGEGFAPPSPS